MPLHRLIYRSTLAIDGARQDVDRELMSIVTRSRLANTAAGLTGALVVSSTGFVTQALEGPLGPLEATFERICRDFRHRQLRLVEFSPADQRAFDDWSLASVQPERELVRLCASMGALEGAHADPAAADAAIQLIRAMVLTAGAGQAAA